MKKLLCIILLVSVHLILLGQVDLNNWYFGSVFSIDFNTENPIFRLEGKIYSIESSATVSDCLGNIILNSDGHTVWNKDDSILKNGDGLDSSTSRLPSSQGVSIVKKTQSGDVFYTFTASSEEEEEEERYSIIDMNLNNGSGGVTLKNRILN